jgi:hypothetical protein
MVTYTVENKDNVATHYFAYGSHTAYACPLNEQTRLSDHVIEFPKRLELKAKTIGASGLLSDTTRIIANDGGILPPSNTLFNPDPLIFFDIQCKWVWLRKKTDKKGMIVRYRNYPHLELWSKPSTAFYLYRTVVRAC